MSKLHTKYTKTCMIWTFPTIWYMLDFTSLYPFCIFYSGVLSLFSWVGQSLMRLQRLEDVPSTSMTRMGLQPSERSGWKSTSFYDYCFVAEATHLCKVQCTPCYSMYCWDKKGLGMRVGNLKYHNYSPDNTPPILCTTSLKWGGSIYSNIRLVSTIHPTNTWIQWNHTMTWL